jgi:hypothetical protein
MKISTNYGHGSDGAKLGRNGAISDQLSAISQNRPTALRAVRAYLTTFRGRCQAQGWLAALFHVGVLEVAVARAESERAQVAADGYSAEQADLEAVKLLEDAARDGLTQSDMAAVAAAIRHIRRSADKDHAIAATG